MASVARVRRHFSWLVRLKHARPRKSRNTARAPTRTLLMIVNELMPKDKGLGLGEQNYIEAMQMNFKYSGAMIVLPQFQFLSNNPEKLLQQSPLTTPQPKKPVLLKHLQDYPSRKLPALAKASTLNPQGLKLETLNPSPQTLNPRPCTRNP